MKYLLILFSLMAASCQSTEEDHGHSHEETGGHAVTGEERPAIVSTIWTDSTELFVEYPALVVDQSSRFAAHFTMLNNHQPVRKGTVTVSLIKGGKGIRQTVEQPASPGIFTPVLQPKEPGVYQLVFDLTTPFYKDRIVVGAVQVHAKNEEAVKAVGHEEKMGGTISFLKEQAWKIGFQTDAVTQGEIYDIIHTSGVWKASPGNNRSLTANANGVIIYAIENLTEGAMVKQGQLLMTISSKGLTTDNLQTEIEKARANYEQVKAEYDRKEQLYASEIIPRSEFEQVESRYQIAKTTYETLQAGYSDGGIKISAPFNGFVKSINIDNGAYVEQGAALITIGSHRSSLLLTQVSPFYAGSLQTIHDIWYQPKKDQWSSIKSTGGSVQSISKDIEAENPLISIYVQVNEEIEMPHGGFTEVQIAIGNAEQSLLLPEEALLEDYGSYSVIAQLSGETFERKPVQIGKRNGKFVEILDGLRAGDRIVTKGAYQVKMASMSGEVPAHGHAH